MSKKIVPPPTSPKVGIIHFNPKTQHGLIPIRPLKGYEGVVVLWPIEKPIHTPPHNSDNANKWYVRALVVSEDAKRVRFRPPVRRPAGPIYRIDFPQGYDLGAESLRLTLQPFLYPPGSLHPHGGDNPGIKA